MKKYIINILCVYVFTLNFGYSEVLPEEKRSQILEAIAKLKPLQVYGKIIDQYGNPVPEARVRLGWTEVRITPDPGQSKWIETDVNGTWAIKINKPHRISVRDIEKEGYQFDRKTSSYFSSPNRYELIKHTSKDEPLIIKVRKKGETTFLVHNKKRAVFRLDSLGQRLNLFEGKSSTVTTNVTDWDIEIDAQFSEERQSWVFDFVADSQKEGGVIIRDDVLYEAPTEGYLDQSRLVVPLKNYRETKSLYIKSREPSVFSRMDIQFSLGKDMCILSYDVWANPYGSRNLEYDRNFEKEWKIRKQLERQASADIREGRRPEKVDIKTLIEENKDVR